MLSRATTGSTFGTGIAFLSAGLAVILAKGQASWVPHNAWLAPAFFTTGGALVVLSVWLGRRRAGLSQDLRHKFEQGAKKAETHGAESPAILAGRDINVTYGPPADPFTTPAGTPKQREAATAGARPNLVFAGSKQKRIFVSPFSRDGIHDPRSQDEREKSQVALVFKFENRSLEERKIARALNVIAKIRFKSQDGRRERIVDYGVWLNSPCNCTEIGIGDTCELVLMCDIDGEFVTFEDRRTTNHQFHDEFSYLDYGNVDGLEIVEIVLVEQNTQATLTRKFKVSRHGNSFCSSEL